MEGDIMSDEKKMIDETEEVSQEINNNETEPHKAEEKPAQRNANDSQNSAKSANNSQNNAKNSNNGAKSAKKPPIIPIVIGCVVLLLAVGAFLLIGGGFLGGSGDGGDGAPFGCLHIFTDWVVDLEPTCTEEGAKHKECLGCKADLGSEVMPAKGHTGEEVSAVSPTCYSWGHDAYIECTECGYSNYNKLDPTHTLTDGVCSICHRRVITSADELLNISLDGDYVLGCDITFEESVSKSIGDYDKPFTGSLDGNGYTIKGLVIYRQYGFIHQNDGVIKNIRLDEYQLEETMDNNSITAGGLVGINNGQIINCSVDGYVLSRDDVGGLVGWNFGVIDNCYSRGTLIGSGEVGGLVAENLGVITNSYSLMDIEVTTSYYDYNCVGGFVAQNYGEIKGCYVECLLETDAHHDGHIGGFVGRNDYLIAFCYAKVDIDCTNPYEENYVAGFVCYNKDVIVNCYAIGSINFNKTKSSYSNNKDRIGGFVADNSSTLIENCYADVDLNAGCVTTSYIGGFSASSSNNMYNCFALGDITCNVVGTNAKYYVYGFSVSLDNKPVSDESCFSSDEQKITMVKADVETDISDKKGYTNSESTLLSKAFLADGYWLEIDLWDFSSEYPTVNFEYLFNHEPISISTKDQLMALSGRAISLNYILTKNIDLGGAEWKPINAVIGEFNGGGHTISGLNYAFNNKQAGFIYQNIGKIKDLSIVDFTIYSDNLESRFSCFAGMVCVNKGKIVGCSAEGNISLNVRSGDNVTRNVGGLCAIVEAGGEIIASSANVDINLKVTVRSGKMFVGGLCGVTSSNSSSFKANAKIDRCYSAGDITVSGYGTKYVGGFAGSGYFITNCYSLGDVNVTNSDGKCEIGGFVGSGNVQYSYSLGNLTAMIYKGGVNAGGFVGAGKGEYCYTYGNLDVTLAENHNMTYKDYDVGGFVGYTIDKYAIGSYAPSNQVIKYKNENFTNDYGTNEKHSTHMSASEILSVRFQTEIVHFPSDVWNIVEGKHPTLKPYTE